MRLGHIGRAGGFGLGNVALKHCDDTDATLVRRNHHSESLFLAHAELGLQNRDNEFARGEVVIHKDDLVQFRALSPELGLRPGNGLKLCHPGNIARLASLLKKIFEII